MLAYLDSSVLLRVIFGEPAALPEFSSIEYAVSSELTQVECLRTIDRARLRLGLTDEDVALRSRAVFEALRRLELVPLSSAGA
jgi:predicted nucleic acid-binding protein